eukprot:g78529.t1
MVCVKWTENGKQNSKKFCINSKRTKEEALQQAQEWYDVNIKPKREMWDNDKKIKKQEYSIAWAQKKQNEKYQCGCGRIVSSLPSTIKTHEKSLKHRAYVSWQK